LTHLFLILAPLGAKAR